MIDFRALLSEEKNLGKNPAAAYKADAFISIDNEISRIKDEDKMMDLREEARNLLEEDSGSIVLSYVAGRILLALRPHEYNMRLNNLLLSFYEAGNWDVVKYIGDLILSASESSKALRVLGDVADHQGEEEKKWDYYERLVKADSSDHDIIVIVADHFEKIGDRKSAMNYYQRALLRLQGTDEIQKMKDIFHHSSNHSPRRIRRQLWSCIGRFSLHSSPRRMVTSRSPASTEEISTISSRYPRGYSQSIRRIRTLGRPLPLFLRRSMQSLHASRSA